MTSMPYEELDDITVETINDNMFSGTLIDIGNTDISIRICENSSPVLVSIAIDDLVEIQEYINTNRM